MLSLVQSSVCIIIENTEGEFFFPLWLSMPLKLIAIEANRLYNRAASARSAATQVTPDTTQSAKAAVALATSLDVKGASLGDPDPRLSLLQCSSAWAIAAGRGRLCAFESLWRKSR